MLFLVVAIARSKVGDEVLRLMPREQCRPEAYYDAVHPQADHGWVGFVGGGCFGVLIYDYGNGDIIIVRMSLRLASFSRPPWFIMHVRCFSWRSVLDCAQLSQRHPGLTTWRFF